MVSYGSTDSLHPLRVGQWVCSMPRYLHTMEQPSLSTSAQVSFWLLPRASMADLPVVSYSLVLSSCLLGHATSLFIISLKLHEPWVAHIANSAASFSISSYQILCHGATSNISSVLLVIPGGSVLVPTLFNIHSICTLRTVSLWPCTYTAHSSFRRLPYARSLFVRNIVLVSFEQASHHVKWLDVAAIAQLAKRRTNIIFYVTCEWGRFSPKYL